MTGRTHMRSASAGFTLVELLIVLSITGLLLSQAVPAIQAFISSAAVRRAGADLHYAATMARNEAIKRNTRTQLRIDAQQWGVFDLRMDPPALIAAAPLDPRARATPGVIAFSSDGRTFPLGARLELEIAPTGLSCTADVGCRTIAVSTGGYPRLCDARRSPGTYGACQ